MIGIHDSIDALDAIVDIAIRSGLPPIAPHLDGFAVVRQRDFAADRGRRLLTATVISAKRSEDVVESDYSRFQAEILHVMAADALHIELLPSISVFRVGWVGVFLLQRRHGGVFLQVARIDASARSVQVPL